MSSSTSAGEGDQSKRQALTNAASRAVHRLSAAAEAEIAEIAKRHHPSAANAYRLQLLTRQQRQFADLEAALPDRSSAWGFTGGAEDGAPLSLRPSALLASGGRLLQSVSKASAQSSRVADLLSYLGKRNPAPQPITDKDCVWLLDNVAFVDAATGDYQAEYVVAVMAQHPTCKVVDAVRAVADTLGRGALDDAALKTIEERIVPFLQDILPGRQVAALHGEDWRLLFSPGGRNGLSSDVRRLPGAKPGALVPTRAEVPAGVNGMLEMQTFYTAKTNGAGDASHTSLRERHWGVISDIDDTIKLTQTSDPIGILQKTFVDPATPIEGMPPLYQYIQARMGDAAPFFYLSASPYNLYPFLHGFRRQFYPHGMLVLRDATLMSVSGLLSTLTLGTQAYKVDRMHKIHGWLPDTTFVCIGDSTQSDPEAYGEIYRTFPGWVGLILIRKVTDIAALGMEEKNDPDRFDKAFEGVPKDKWHVFEHPHQCYALVQQAVGTGTAAEAVAAAAAAAAEATTSQTATASAGDDE
ncbi:actin filament organization protein app1 [Sporothrix brasiliensis 5110]|uniref:Actin filament organization protein app1 n=1 Tax=Sporothrix brasiliensis 5110 TaxID=1398154 RepID=A0A0C2J1U0_9PEZI|nr:actin filament organization protein app1 [Sporothrix brasiliensis 5110]KIH91067.1 actin filament organization protein app1 [Sporothrix brasiliensis 5110]